MRKDDLWDSWLMQGALGEQRSEVLWEMDPAECCTQVGDPPATKATYHPESTQTSNRPQGQHVGSHSLGGREPSDLSVEVHQQPDAVFS